MVSQSEEFAFIAGMDALQDELEAMTQRLLGPKIPMWLEVTEYLSFVTDETFQRLSLGGQFRGVTWPYFSLNSIDGTRPSGAPLRPGDALLRDTNTLFNSALGTIFKETPTELEIGTALDYAIFHQEGTKRDGKEAIPARPFLFVTNEDAGAIAEIMLDFFKFNPAGTVF